MIVKVFFRTLSNRVILFLYFVFMIVFNMSLHFAPLDKDFFATFTLWENSLSHNSHFRLFAPMYKAFVKKLPLTFMIFFLEKDLSQNSHLDFLLLWMELIFVFPSFDSHKLTFECLLSFMNQSCTYVCLQFFLHRGKTVQ